MTDVAAVILAAGAGQRLGGVAKALLPGRGGTFLATIAGVLADVGVAASRALVVVAPPHGDAVAAEATRLGMASVVNPEPARGMGSSVGVGFAGLGRDVRFSDTAIALLWPVDHARVGAGAVRAVIAAARAHGAALPTWQGRGGHPVAVGRALWPARADAGALPEGARSVLRGRAARVAVDDPGVVADVDTPADREAS